MLREPAPVVALAARTATGSRTTAAPPADASFKVSTSPATTSRSTRVTSFGVAPSSQIVARYLPAPRTVSYTHLTLPTICSV